MDFTASDIKLATDAPQELDAYIASNSGKSFVLFDESIKQDASPEVKAWLKSQHKCGIAIKPLDINAFTKIATSYENQNRQVVKQIKKSIEIPEDLGLADDVRVVFGLSEKLPAESRDQFAFIRPKTKSTVGYLYYSDSVLGNDAHKQAYKTAKDLLDQEAWCTSTRTIKASYSVVQYLLGYEKGVLEGDESESFSDSKKEVYQLVRRALERRSSDIHIYYLHDSPGMIVFRIDKAMTQYTSMAESTLASMCRQMFNNMKNNDTKNSWSSDLIQEADISLTVKNGEKDEDLTLRWQSSPMDGGSKVVLRILKNDHSGISKLSYTDLGYTDKHDAMLHRAFATNKGLILTVGVTGSGKSTTNMKILVDMLAAHPDWNFDTCEDPIEYRIEGIAQHSIEAGVVSDSNASEEQKRKIAFQMHLKALMRQDPDVISLGEIRDDVTAELVRDFVNTGHKIITTLHADSAIYTYDRLEDIGIDKTTLCRPGFFNLITCQMLLAKVCPHCSLSLNEIQGLPEYTFLKNGLAEYSQNIRIKNPEGCKHCSGGNKGMTACCEMLMPDKEFNQYMREGDYIRAEDTWRKGSDDLKDFEYQGSTMLEHFIWKVAHGEVCPIHCCSEFDSIEYIFSGKDYSHIFNKKANHLKAIESAS